jgi:hypothetical protein
MLERADALQLEALVSGDPPAASAFVLPRFPAGDRVVALARHGRQGFRPRPQTSISCEDVNHSPFGQRMRCDRISSSAIWAAGQLCLTDVFHFGSPAISNL